MRLAQVDPSAAGNHLRVGLFQDQPVKAADGLPSSRAPSDEGTNLLLEPALAAFPVEPLLREPLRTVEDVGRYEVV